MEDIDVPPFFLCPISLELMRDPVTVSTGITYDRESIEKWLYSNKNVTCPVTKQVISDSDLTPNHTLRRLIQSWCTMNASRGVERIPTPKPVISKAQIGSLIADAKSSSPSSQLKCIRRLQSMASQNETNKRCIEAAGVEEFLASIVINSVSDEAPELGEASEEALSLLNSLQLSETSCKSLLATNANLVQSLNSVMQGRSYQSRAHAIILLKSVLEVADPLQLTSFRVDFFTEIFQIVKDEISQHASKAALQSLIMLCPWGRNKVKAVQAGGVSVLIDLLLESSDRRTCEMALTSLDMLCGCAEGRAELLNHGAGLAVVSKKILRVSMVGNERAVRILHSVAKFSATPSIVQEMLSLGVVAKLCLVLQADCGKKATDRAREILRLHSRAWRNSPCIPMHLILSYPS